MGKHGRIVLKKKAALTSTLIPLVGTGRYCQQIHITTAYTKNMFAGEVQSTVLTENNKK